MAMGRQKDGQGDLMVSWSEMPRSPGHVFYDRLQSVLIEGGFDAFAEASCRPWRPFRKGLSGRCRCDSRKVVETDLEPPCGRRLTDTRSAWLKHNVTQPFGKDTPLRRQGFLTLLLLDPKGPRPQLPAIRAPCWIVGVSQLDRSWFPPIGRIRDSYRNLASPYPTHGWRYSLLGLNRVRKPKSPRYYKGLPKPTPPCCKGVASTLGEIIGEFRSAGNGL